MRERPVPTAGYVIPVRVMIDAAGQVTACVVQAPTANEAYRRSVCEQFARRYQQALDAQGRPIVQIGTDEILRVPAN